MSSTSSGVWSSDDGSGTWNLPGGTPEPRDGGDEVATLVREVWEEVQVTFTDSVYLGHQTVHRPGTEPYAQLRMAARLDRLGEREPDPDHGRIHTRRVSPLHQAVSLLGWGPPAKAQFRCAAMTAERRWGLPVGAPAPACID
ncbi:NUDIX domain-containing protein [Nocardiopsis sp. Huas11]|uniref:NUDIX hydrolase n=1 Tax=Nocardiopsis sp. Huas11 TaxID=2183912 RepID=UPI000F196A7E|nr:NUDIX hydrolase [Nocardiopsis sp. Huas11]RKS09295.1 NUDIX domain-containing protein [Nocardiopsis sp. Huas11]